jgi:hypothetical protein
MNYRFLDRRNLPYPKRVVAYDWITIGAPCAQVRAK